ncbi:unnamed protein product [Closterium sp. NIES-54]
MVADSVLLIHIFPPSLPNSVPPWYKPPLHPQASALHVLQKQHMAEATVFALEVSACSFLPSPLRSAGGGGDSVGTCEASGGVGETEQVEEGTPSHSLLLLFHPSSFPILSPFHAAEGLESGTAAGCGGDSVGACEASGGGDAASHSLFLLLLPSSSPRYPHPAEGPESGTAAGGGGDRVGECEAGGGGDAAAKAAA